MGTCTLQRCSRRRGQFNTEISCSRWSGSFKETPQHRPEVRGVVRGAVRVLPHKPRLP